MCIYTHMRKNGFRDQTQPRFLLRRKEKKKKKTWYWIWYSQFQLPSLRKREKRYQSVSAIYRLAPPLFGSRTIVIEAVADGSVPLETSCLSSTRTRSPGPRSIPDLLGASSCIAKVRRLLSTALFQFAVFRSVRRGIDKGLDRERVRESEKERRAKGNGDRGGGGRVCIYMFYAYTCMYVRTLRHWCSRDSRFLVPRPEWEKERGLVHTQYRAVRKRQLLDATVRGYGGPIDVKCSNDRQVNEPRHGALVPRCTLPNGSLVRDHAIVLLFFFFTARSFPGVQQRDLEHLSRHFARCNCNDQ